ncbi:hypothetical protein C8Q80DRAFT_1275387 [Daedaleopsis nitida]|nr:hypothetical protein C8Q80DRAFT_1275387 [Daedaleopsis nitida]
MAQQPPFHYPFLPYAAQPSNCPQGPGSQYPTVYHPQQAVVNFGSAYGSRKCCWMCGQTEGAGLQHPIGMRNCPDTQQLLQERIIAYNPQNGRLVKALDGSELPPWHMAPNSIAALLWEELAKSPRQQRDIPPHQSAHVHSIGVLCDGEPVFSYARTPNADTFHSLPVSTRSQTNRPESVNHPLPAGSGKTVRFDTPSDDDDEAAVDSTVPASVKPGTAPPKINTGSGWKDSRLERGRGESTLRSKFGAKPYRFTSDVQESVSVNEIEDHLLLTKVSLTLRELLGIAPSLQKRFGTLVKTRREPDVKDGPGVRTAAAVDVLSSLSTDASSLEASVVFDRSETSLTELLDRYASSLALGFPRTFAMVSGLAKGTFGDQLITFLVDTGSELNLVFFDVWERSKMPMNEDGARWSLKGLGGQPVPLLGCAVDAKVQVGGRNFDHHFFVLSALGNGIYGGILGQPWLAYFAANIQYERSGETVLTVFPSGNSKGGGGVAIAVSPKNHPRNALVLTSRVEPPADAQQGFSVQARSLRV